MLLKPDPAPDHTKRDALSFLGGLAIGLVLGGALLLLILYTFTS